MAAAWAAAAAAAAAAARRTAAAGAAGAATVLVPARSVRRRPGRPAVSAISLAARPQDEDAADAAVQRPLRPGRRPTGDADASASPRRQWVPGALQAHPPTSARPLREYRPPEVEPAPVKPAAPPAAAAGTLPPMRRRAGGPADTSARSAIEPLWLRNARRAQEEAAASAAVAAEEESAPKGHMTLEEVLAFLHDENAQHVCVIDISARATFAKHLVILEGFSRRHLGAMADALVSKLKRRRIPEIEFAQVEGRDTDWMIVDAGNLVVHFFMPAERAYYDLESLWTSMDPDEWLPKPTPEGGAAPSAQQ